MLFLLILIALIGFLVYKTIAGIFLSIIFWIFVIGSVVLAVVKNFDSIKGFFRKDR